MENTDKLVNKVVDVWPCNFGHFKFTKTENPHYKVKVISLQFDHSEEVYKINVLFRFRGEKV